MKLRKISTILITLLIAFSLMLTACDTGSSSKSKKNKKHKKDKDDEQIEEVEDDEDDEDEDEDDDEDEPDETTEAPVETEETEPDDLGTSPYDELILETIEYMANFDEDSDESLAGMDKEGFFWAYIDCSQDGADLIARNTGFAYKDLNDDGTPELLFINSLYNEDLGCGSNVKAIFTYNDKGVVECVAEGWYRNAYYIADNNEFIYFASSGAASSYCGVLDFNNQYLAQEFSEFYFTEPDEDYNDIFFYSGDDFSSTGADSTEITEDDYYAIIDELYDSKVPTEYTSFYEYANELGLDVDFPSLPFEANAWEISRQDYEEAYYSDIYIATYGINDDDSQCFVYFYCSGSGTITLKSIDSIDYDDNANMICTYSVAADPVQFGIYQGMVLSFNSYGDLPNYAVEVETISGDVYTYAISFSGDTGEVILIPVE